MNVTSPEGAPVRGTTGPDSGQPPSLPQALESLLRWREGAEVAVVGALEDISLEEEDVGRQLAEVSRQVKALAALRAEQEALRAGLGREQRRLELEAVRSCLADERRALAERNFLWNAAARLRESTLQERLADPETAALIADWERLSSTEALGSLPFSYRQARAEQRDKVWSRLAPLLAAANAPPDLRDQPALGCSVVLATEPAEGRPETLVVVIPVPATISKEWATREDDLLGFLSWRVVSVLFMLLREIDALDAPLRSVDLHGSLALTVWLGDHTVPEDLQERTLDLFQAMTAEATELEYAAVELYAMWVSPGLLATES